MNPNINITPEEQDTIESYLLNRMPVRERESFEQQLATDGSLTPKVHLMKLVLLGIQEETIASRLDEFHKVKKLASPKVKPVKTWMTAASVLLVVAVGMLLVFLPGKDRRIFNEFYSPDSGLIGAMSTEDQEYLFETAMIDYKSKKYDQAIMVWKQLLQTRPGSDTLNYFIGSAHLAKSEARKSLPYLQQVIGQKQSAFYADACWYYGLALIKLHQRNKSVIYIRQSDHPKKETLLERLSAK